MARRSRIACLAVDNFLIAALCRAEPELWGQAVAVTDGQGARAPVVAVSPEAERAGVSLGMSAAQALAAVSSVTLRPLCEDNIRAAENALVDVAWSFSPCVENAGKGLVFLEVGGSGAMHENERKLAAALTARCSRVGFKVKVGVGSSKVVARLAACAAEALAVPEGKEAEFMAPLPVTFLQMSDNLSLTLRRWGIRRIGQLASLPPDQVVVRLGEEGWKLLREVRGEDLRPLSPVASSTEFAEGVELEYAAERSEPLLFLLRAMLDRLLSRLAVRAMVAGGLKLSLGLTGAVKGETEERAIDLVAPTSEAKVLLAMLRVNLEQKPPAAAVERIKLAIQPVTLRHCQLDLFSPARVTPGKLNATLARLIAACGANSVGSPAVADSHHPDRFELAQFSRAQPADEGEAGELPSDFGRLVLRAIRPPSAVEVLCARGWPDFLRGPVMGGRVISVAGPWRVEGEWWTKSGGFQREYFNLELSDGCICRAYRELESNRWFVDGVYD